MLTLRVTAEDSATGRFRGDLAFMWLRAHRRRFYEPGQARIQRAEVSTVAGVVIQFPGTFAASAWRTSCVPS